MRRTAERILRVVPRRTADAASPAAPENGVGLQTILTPSAPPPERSITRRLTRRYVLALAAIALLGIVGQVLVQVSIAQLSMDTHVIEIAALQRTLAERLSKDALAVLQAPDPSAQGTYIHELLAVVPQWEHTHLALQQGDPAMGLPGNNSPTVRRLFAQIAPAFNVMQDNATTLLALYESQPPVSLPTTQSVAEIIAPYVELILQAEPGFIAGMDAIVAQYQREADARVLRLQIIEWSLLAVEGLVIALLVLIVFRPATRYVGRSVTELVRAQKREHELATLKDQFIVDVNHELRTPVMALYNNLEILNALGERAKPEQRAAILSRALSSGDAVLRLLHNVLDATALEGKPPRLEYSRVALAPLVQAVLETFDPSEVGEPALLADRYEARAVTMHVPADLVVWADESRLRQVLINLLTNALKYSADGSPITITAAAYVPSRAERHHMRGEGASTMAAAGQVQISVRDYGNGIPQDDIPKLFNRFVRLERDIAGPVRGTGVGLYMCRVLTEAMGGRIWVESSGTPGEGSTFSLLLPSAPVSAEPEAHGMASAASAGSAHFATQ